MFAAASPLHADIGGVHLGDNDSSAPATPRPIDFGTRRAVPIDLVPHAVDPGSARRLREPSGRLLGPQG